MEILYGHSVVTVNFHDWQNLVRVDGAPTVVEQIPEKLSGVMRDAEVVAVAASGIANPNPGINIVRKDVKDAPMIYNTDHYTVVERITSHPDYGAIPNHERQRLRCVRETLIRGPGLSGRNVMTITGQGNSRIHQECNKEALTMRRSEPGHRAAVAIYVRGPISRSLQSVS